MVSAKIFGLGDILEKVQAELEGAGITVDVATACVDDCETDGPIGVKVVCVSPGLKSSVEEMGKSARDQVVMVRVDSDTSRDLDAWVETGAVKSRSEAAALFMREGLKVRADELSRLKEALDDVEGARERLRQKAREVFGE